MALIPCPECDRKVSSLAKSCPGCGFPVADAVVREPAEAVSSPPAGSSAPAELLLEVHPSWWNYVWHLLFFWLIVPPLLAWLQRSSTVLRISSNRVTLERGLFAKCYQDFLPRDIRSIDVDQSFFDRLAGIGSITISTAAAVEGAETVCGIPNPQHVRELILAQRGDA